MTFRSRGWAISVALLLGACWFPIERGQRLEQRVERMEGEGPTKVDEHRATQAGTQEQARRLDAKMAEVQGKLNDLGSAAQEARTERSARQDKLDKLAEEVSRLRGALEGYAHRLDSVERTVGQLHAGAGRGVPERKVASAPGTSMKPEAPEPPRSKTSFLALAREQEAKGQKAVARDLYQEYVQKFPTDPDAAQAHFRLGELAFGERRYPDAIAEYGKVAKDFPRSDAAPDALLRTAESMIQIDMKDDAMTVLSEIPKRYPASSAATRAKQRLAELGEARPASKKKRP